MRGFHPPLGGKVVQTLAILGQSINNSIAFLENLRAHLRGRLKLSLAKKNNSTFI